MIILESHCRRCLQQARPSSQDNSTLVKQIGRRCLLARQNVTEVPIGQSKCKHGSGGQMGNPDSSHAFLLLRVKTDIEWFN